MHPVYWNKSRHRTVLLDEWARPGSYSDGEGMAESSGLSKVQELPAVSANSCRYPMVLKSVSQPFSLTLPFQYLVHVPFQLSILPHPSLQPSSPLTKPSHTHPFPLPLPWTQVPPPHNRGLLHSFPRAGKRQAYISEENKSVANFNENEETVHGFWDHWAPAT